jgi:glycine/D-amino acid oxidase-like deaminating enzyme
VRTADVVIAGAGIAGIATAWQIAARLGTTTTVLVDPRSPLSLTSDRPGANYRDWWPQPSMVALADRSIELTEGLLAAGATFAMDRRGYLFVTADPATASALPTVRAERIEAGVAPDAATVLGADELRARYPHLAPHLVGAILARRAGSLDTVGLGQAMLAIAEAAGVEVIRGEVVGTTMEAGRIAAVTIATPDGSLEVATEHLVNAAGPFARRLALRLGWDLDLETVLRQKVVLRDPLGIVPRDAPFTIGLDPTSGAPAGIHVKPDTAGIHDTLKLGWARDQTPSEPVADPPCAPRFPREVIARAMTLVPDLGAYLAAPEILAHDGGFYARSPDGLPLIGPLGPTGAFIVGGLAGFGSMMACAAGELTAAWVLDEPRPIVAVAFDPGRIGTPASTARSGGVQPAGEL